MSLINQMLQDLENRQSNAQSSDESVFAHLDPASGGFARPSRATHWFVPPLILGVAVVSAAYLAPLGFGRELLTARNAYQPLPALPSLSVATAADGRGAGASLNSDRAALQTDEPRDFFQLSSRIDLAALSNAAPLLDADLELEADRLNALLRENPPAAAAPAEGRGSMLALVEGPDSDTVTNVLSEGAGGVEKEVLPISPEDGAENLYREGVSALRRGDPVAAETQLQRALEAWPIHVKAREMLVVQLLQRNDVARALAVAREGVELTPKEPGIAKIYARLQAERGHIDLALATLGPSAPPVSADPEHHAFIAALLQRAGRHPEAVARYRVVLAQVPDHGIWWMGLAISLEAIGKRTDALGAFRRAASSKRVEGAVRQYVNARVAALSS